MLLLLLLFNDLVKQEGHVLKAVNLLDFREKHKM